MSKDYQTIVPIKEKERLGLDFVYTFKTFPEPFFRQETGTTPQVDVLFVTAHSEQEEETVFRKRKLLEEKPGNPSDYEYVPLLAVNLASTFLEKTGQRPPIIFDNMRMRIDIELDMEREVPNHNLITIGAGNANSFTRRVFEDLQQRLGTLERVPVHFGYPAGHDMIVSTISGGRWHSNDDAALILMIPNIYSRSARLDKRPDRVIIIVAGTEIEGTIAGILALCKQIDRRNRHLQDNNLSDRSKEIPARIVRAVTNTISLQETPPRLSGSYRQVVDFEFLE